MRNTQAKWIFETLDLFPTFMTETISRIFRYWKLMSVKKILYLPRILSAKEKGIFTVLFFTVLLSGVFFFGKIYLRLTVPVPAVGGSYTEGILGEPRVINPIFTSRDAERDLARLIFSGLFTYNSTGNIIGDLAEKYEVSEDGKIYIVTLRKNLLWHDNTPLTADDVAFTIHTIQNTQYKSPLRPNWQGVNIEIADPLTVRFILRTPYAPFIENLTVGIIPKHIWEPITPEQSLLHEQALTPVGSGPYQFDEMRQEKDGTISWYQLRRNARYYREGPHLSAITFIFYRNEDDMFAAVRTGKIDGYGPISEKFFSHISKNTASVHAIEMPRIFGIFYNDQKTALFTEKPIRQAIGLALNREEIAKNVVSGGAVPFAYPLPGFLSLHEQNVPEHAYNVEGAKHLLRQAGWNDSDEDGILDRKPRKGKADEKTKLAFVLRTSDWPDLVRTAEVIKEELRVIGVDITIETFPFPDLEAKVIRPRDFEILLFGEVYGREPDPFPFWHSSQIKDPGLNVAIYASKKADRILEEARKSSDLAVRKERYKEFEEMITNDIPAVFLYSQTFIYLLPNDIQGVNLNKISLPADRFNEINKWFRETKRVFK